ncbi:hypothetical protein A2576_00530 [Candidatus Amesbacteria bacterium RIFOXYD1_FULL_47_9]|uniref:Glycosyltransferase RgtA/B/C/D-like domain-containing protein n=2 Tax=Candidatus Amesiibacteriota TaxID=1752730 RepID=A0A1F5A087_9BACT|nr:MAG: hypothetical protein UX78_C0003G0058 [Candidatus Amesbacteria bacterium GW2011_GWA2_47_11]OGC90489.1 MAG: hypothetical protein A2V48_00315 [Candidatus Amesbacteria bacterium RBG_19FT_COMBO_48_16]OGC99133.1 MAG: hypothetical protein A2702_01200 [Candidatus Amesbacteria bacterium RIFCSPHIGHO2_01_FULL_48_75]OGD02093.1 MAG: hypothetical protein A2354_02935 [Candidatus Amesbacteria bacterium RIFOXYB1_FULL_47_12]OGD05678.1 MAG: hypothetical protein A3B58_04405 [Candidatus Amesbacteria bacteri
MSFPKILRLFLLWQLVIILITAAAFTLLPLRTTFIGGSDQASRVDPQPYIRNPLLYSRANFDGIHYVDVARKGYGYAQQAFFPLYPRLINILSKYIHPPALAGILISLASFLVGLIYFARLIRLDYSPKVAFWTIVALLVFPTSFFISAVYTEGLFFLQVILAFYFARTGRWWAASIIGMSASYTRFAGVFLFPALILEWWHQRSHPESRKKPGISDLLCLAFIPLGLVIFMHYLYHTTGDLLAFIHVQKLFQQGRGDKIIMIYQVYWRYLKMIFTVNRSDPLYLTILLEFFSAILFTVTSVVSLIKQRASYSLFNVLNFITPTLSGTFTSVPRYVLLCFPSFLLFGQWLSLASGTYRRLYIAASLGLFILFLMLFVRGYWVA